MSRFERFESLVGSENINKLKNSTVAIFGIGGVGSYAVETIARSGIGKVILVDNDNYCDSNVNRQLYAISETIGKSKVQVAEKRIKQINPNAEVISYNLFFDENSIDDVFTNEIDYVIDAIDSIGSKILLIEECKKRKINIISCMGTAKKINPTQLEVADIYKTSVCPLAKIVRKELKNRGIKELKVVYSKEQPMETVDGSDVLGSTAFVPSCAGIILASEVIKDLLNVY